MQLSDASVMLCVVILQHRRGTNKAGGRERWMMVLGGAVTERKREKNGSKMMREQESAMTKAWKSLLLLVMRITSGEQLWGDSCSLSVSDQRREDLSQHCHLLVRSGTY